MKKQIIIPTTIEDITISKFVDILKNKDDEKKIFEILTGIDVEYYDNINTENKLLIDSIIYNLFSELEKQVELFKYIKIKNDTYKLIDFYSLTNKDYFLLLKLSESLPDSYSNILSVLYRKVKKKWFFNKFEGVEKIDYNRIDELAQKFESQSVKYILGVGFFLQNWKNCWVLNLMTMKGMKKTKVKN
jgi:hypothetical protein